VSYGTFAHYYTLLNHFRPHFSVPAPPSITSRPMSIYSCSSNVSLTGYILFFMRAYTNTDFPSKVLSFGSSDVGWCSLRILHAPTGCTNPRMVLFSASAAAQPSTRACTLVQPRSSGTHHPTIGRQASASRAATASKGENNVPFGHHVILNISSGRLALQ
jgi:hypothetical protein